MRVALRDVHASASHTLPYVVALFCPSLAQTVICWRSGTFINVELPTTVLLYSRIVSVYLILNDGKPFSVYLFER